MPFHVSYRFQQQSTKLGGWSENFWHPGLDVNVVAAAAKEIVGPRFVCSSDQAYCNSIRVSDLSDDRKVKTIYIEGAGPATYSATYDADYPATALSIKLSDAAGRSTTQWIRGIPDKIIAKSGTYQPTGISGYTTKIKALWQALIDQGFCIRKLVKGGDLNKPRTISDFIAATGILTYTGGSLGADGALLTVRIKGFTSYPPVNKVWKVIVLTGTPTQLKINLWQAPPVGTVFTGNNPTVTVQAYNLTPIAKGEVVFATSKYTGRPTGLLGGGKRRRKKV